MFRISSRFSSLHQEIQFCLLKDSEAGKLTVVAEQIVSWKWGWPLAGLGAGKWSLEWLQGVWRVANETAGSAMRIAKGSGNSQNLEKMMVKEPVGALEDQWGGNRYSASPLTASEGEDECCGYTLMQWSAVLELACIIADLTLDLWAAKECQLLESVLSQFYWTFSFPLPPPGALAALMLCLKQCAYAGGWCCCCKCGSHCCWPCFVRYSALFSRSGASLVGLNHSLVQDIFALLGNRRAGCEEDTHSTRSEPAPLWSEHLLFHILAFIFSCSAVKSVSLK